MAPYIDFNTEMRKNAKDDFEKDLFKLLNSAVFGKSMENVFNHIDFRLVTESNKYEKMVASPLYKESHAFTEDLTGVLMSKEKAILNRPIYTGFSILELSKTLMYDFHYNYVQERFPKARLMFTDTYSLCYHIEDEHLFEKLLQDRDRWFDNSDYPVNNPLYSLTNRKKIGYMKDEKCSRNRGICGTQGQALEYKDNVCRAQKSEGNNTTRGEGDDHTRRLFEDPKGRNTRPT